MSFFIPGCHCGGCGQISHRLFDESGNLLWSRNLWKEGDSVEAVICRDGQSVIAWSPYAATPNLLRKYAASNGRLLYTGPTIGASGTDGYSNRPVASDSSGNVFVAEASGLYVYHPDLTSNFNTPYPSPAITGTGDTFQYVSVSPDDSKIAVLKIAVSSGPFKYDAALWEFDSSGSVQWDLRWSTTSANPSPPYTVGYDISNVLWTGCWTLATQTKTPTGGSGGPYKAFVSYDSSGNITGDKYGSEPLAWTATDYSEKLPYKTYGGGSAQHDIYDPDGSGFGVGSSIYNSYPKYVSQLCANTSGDKVAVTLGDGLYFYPSNFSGLLWSFPETASSAFKLDCIDGLVLIGGPFRSR